MNVRSLEPALAVRRMVIVKTQSPPDDAAFADQQKIHDSKGREIDQEARAARALINAIIDDTSTESDNARLGRIDDRIENVVNDLRRHLSEENKRLIPLLAAGLGVKTGAAARGIALRKRSLGNHTGALISIYFLVGTIGTDALDGMEQEMIRTVARTQPYG